MEYNFEAEQHLLGSIINAANDADQDLVLRILNEVESSWFVHNPNRLAFNLISETMESGVLPDFAVLCVSLAKPENKDLYHDIGTEAYLVDLWDRARTQVLPNWRFSRNALINVKYDTQIKNIRHDDKIDAAEVGERISILEDERRALLRDRVTLKKKKDYKGITTREKIGKEFLFENNYIPRKELTILPAANGTGKSFLLSQIALQAASGRCFMQYQDTDGETQKLYAPKTKMKVLVLTFEDEVSTFIERMVSIFHKYPNHGMGVLEFENILENDIEIISMPDDFGLHYHLAAPNANRMLEPTATYNYLLKAIKGDAYDLVLLDPYHYGVVADSENDNTGMGIYAGMMRHLAKQTDCGILAFAHTSDSNPLRVRGATATNDRVRQRILCSTMNDLIQHQNKTTHVPKPQESSLYDIGRGDMQNVVWMYMTKNSYAALEGRYHLFERIDGILIPFACKDDPVADWKQLALHYITESSDGLSTPEIKKKLGDDGIKWTSTLPRYLDSLVELGTLKSRKQGSSKHYEIK